MSPKKVRTIFARFAQANPAPTTELEYATPYQLLVAVILSAQATDKSVNLATRELFRVAGTPRKMARLGEAGLAPCISRIGLYKTKAKNVAAMTQILLDRYGGEVPHDRTALEALPGVGAPKALSCVRLKARDWRSVSDRPGPDRPVSGPAGHGQPPWRLDRAGTRPATGRRAGG